MTKVYEGVEQPWSAAVGGATMVRTDHVNSWWGVELLIPLLKHTNEIYFV